MTRKTRKLINTCDGGKTNKPFHTFVEIVKFDENPTDASFVQYSVQFSSQYEGSTKDSETARKFAQFHLNKDGVQSLISALQESIADA